MRNCAKKLIFVPYICSMTPFIPCRRQGNFFTAWYRNIVFTIITLLCAPALHAQQPADIKILTEQLATAADDSIRINIYNKIATYYTGNNNDSALLWIKQGLDYFKRKNNKLGEAWMHVDKGDFEDTKNNNIAAEREYTEGLQLYTALGNKKGIAAADNNLGTLEGKIGNYNKSLAYFMEAKKNYEEMGNRNGMMNCYINLGVLYDELKDSVNTIFYYKKADSISKTLPFSTNTIAICINIGEFYSSRNDTARALEAFAKARALSNKPDFAMVHLIATLNWCTEKFIAGDPEAARKELYPALAYARQHELGLQEADIYITLATYDNSLNVDTAQAYLYRALAIAQGAANKPQELNIYKTLVTFFEKHDDYKLANKYLKLQQSLSDSLLSESKARDISNLTARYELERSVAQVKRLEFLIAKNKTQKTIILIIGCIIAILFVVLYFFYKKAAKLNKTLQKKQSDLNELNQMKDKLLSIISHDLRGPIGNVPVVLDFISAEPAIPETYREMFPVLSENIHAILETLDNLLLLGKSFAQKNKCEKSTFDPIQYIDKNLQLLNYSREKKHIQIIKSLPQGILLKADPMHFDFTVRNLLSNAIKFSYPNGTVEISADLDKLHGFAVFALKDHGTGISEKRKESMFKPNVQSTYGTENEKGTGLGLLLCHEFVTQNGGKIWVESEVGKGSTFYFTMMTAS
jgi:signal transduction histidine kinase